MNKVTLLALGFIALLAGCTKKPAEHEKPDVIVQAQLGQAKHFDIPVPLSFSLISKSSQKQQSGYFDSIKYTGSLSVCAVVKFYVREMERNGWDVTNLSDQQEGFLFCNKPTKSCGIYIQLQDTAHKKRPTIITLFIAQK